MLLFYMYTRFKELTDPNQDGVAAMENIVEGFRVRVSFIGMICTDHESGRTPVFFDRDRGYHVESSDGKIHEASGREPFFAVTQMVQISGLCNGLRNRKHADDNGIYF